MDNCMYVLDTYCCCCTRYQDFIKWTILNKKWVCILAYVIFCDSICINVKYIRIDLRLINKLFGMKFRLQKQIFVCNLTVHEKVVNVFHLHIILNSAVQQSLNQGCQLYCAKLLYE